MNFLNAPLLWGALLFAVPLAIHLLNRRRYKVLRWAAQDFLLRAFQTTRRRLQLESLLLLIARCLLVVLLALALSRPRLPSAPSLIFTAAQRQVVLVVDTSYSMARAKGGVETALDRAKEKARHLLDTLSAERGDRVTLLTLDANPELTATADLELARDKLDRLDASFRSADLIKTLNRLNEEVLAPSSASHEVFVFTDLQRQTFQPGAGGEARKDALDATNGLGEAAPASAWRAAAVPGAATFTLVDVGDERPSENLAVEDLTVRPANVVRDEVVTFTATVRNYAGRELRGLRGTFVVDGRRELGKQVVFDVPPGGRAAVECSTILRESGSTGVEFALEDDELDVDNRRYLAFPVHEAVRVLLVDGKASEAPSKRATYYLANVLNPYPDPETGGTIFHTKIVDDRRFNLRSENLADYDLIVLANVARLDRAVAQELETAVRAGRGLLVFLGDQVDPRAWNEVLYRPDGTGLLPAMLGDVKGDPRPDSELSYSLRIDDYDHPILELFADDALQQNLDCRVRRWFSVERSPKDSATSVVIRLNDDPAAPSPIVLEKPVGRGRVMLWTTAAGYDPTTWWTDLPNLGWAFLPLMHETASYLTLPDLRRFNLGVGQPLRLTARSIPSEMAVVPPDGTRQVQTDPPREQENGEFVLPTFARTVEPGLYAVELSFPLSGTGNDLGRRATERFAVNVDSAESDLARVQPDAFAQLYPGVDVRIVRDIDTTTETRGDAEPGELWRTLALAALILLALEMAMAWFFGRARSGGG